MAATKPPKKIHQDSAGGDRSILAIDARGTARRAGPQSRDERSPSAVLNAVLNVDTDLYRGILRGAGAPSDTVHDLHTSCHKLQGFEWKSWRIDFDAKLWTALLVSIGCRSRSAWSRSTVF